MRFAKGMRVLFRDFELGRRNLQPRGWLATQQSTGLDYVLTRNLLHPIALLALGGAYLVRDSRGRPWLALPVGDLSAFSERRARLQFFAGQGFLELSNSAAVATTESAAGAPLSQPLGSAKSRANRLCRWLVAVCSAALVCCAATAGLAPLTAPVESKLLAPRLASPQAHVDRLTSCEFQTPSKLIPVANESLASELRRLAAQQSIQIVSLNLSRLGGVQLIELRATCESTPIEIRIQALRDGSAFELKRMTPSANAEGQIY